MIDTKKLRQKILDLAIRGKLVPQDPNDEPASVLLERIREEKERLIAEGKIKRDKKESVIFRGADNLHYEKIGDGEPVCIEDEIPFEIPGSWEWVRSSQVAYVACGQTPAKNCFKSSGIPYIKMYNIRNQKIDFWFNPQFIDEDTHNTKLARSRARPGDLLMNIVGPPLGKLALIPPDLPECNFNQAAVMYRVYKFTELNEWLYYYLSEMSEINSIVTKGTAGQANISLTQAKNFRIPIPPAAEVVRIIGTLRCLLGLADSIERTQQQLESLVAQAKAKILDLAIRGKLVPQDPNDEPASALLERIRKEKERLIAEGKIKRDKKESYIFRGDDNSYYRYTGKTDELIDRELPFGLPPSWTWCQLGMISNYGEVDSVSADKIPEQAWILDLEDIEKSTGRVLVYRTKADRPFQSTKRPFKKGQLLYSKLRPYLNKVLIAPKDGYCTSEILPISLPGGMIPEYVCSYLRSDQFLQYANQCSYGVKMPRLETRDGKQAIIPLPPTTEQARIARCVDDIIEALNNLAG